LAIVQAGALEQRGQFRGVRTADYVG